jgi:hypothetical protein
MRQVEAGRRDGLALGTDPLEEHHRIDAGPAPLAVELARLLADEAQIEPDFEIAVEVVGRDEVLQRDRDGLVEGVGFGRAKH